METLENLESYIKQSNITFCKNCNSIYEEHCGKCWARCIKCNKIVPKFIKPNYKGSLIKCSLCLNKNNKLTKILH